ncbi:MAG TPA: hypothetical protein VGN38_04995 [Caulobacteraceae bacterium]|jgi:hypothetical protein|nr:hypothetical protein [Caulobacteraceae bacterium]
MKLILALVMTRILAGGSASVALNQWCVAHHLPPLAAHRVAGSAKSTPTAVRSALGAGAIAYRRVWLACGPVRLLVGDNWYLPSRLTPAMNRRLETSEAPFGLVVRPLGFHRHTLSVDGPVVRALVVDDAGRPLSYVVETYVRALGD